VRHTAWRRARRWSSAARARRDWGRSSGPRRLPCSSSTPWSGRTIPPRARPLDPPPPSGRRPARSARRPLALGQAPLRRARASGHERLHAAGHHGAAPSCRPKARPRHKRNRVAAAAGMRRGCDAACSLTRDGRRGAAIERLTRFAGRAARCRWVQPVRRRTPGRERRLLHVGVEERTRYAAPGQTR